MAVVVEPAGLNFSQRMTILLDTVKLPVLPLDDIVVLPGMVVPLRLADAEIRAAIEAGRAAITADSGGQAQVLLVPRLDGKYASVGAWGVVEQIGRLPGGDQAAVVRGTSRARIGTGTTGPGAALWVEATVLDETAADDRARELAREYRGLVTTILQRRGAWQVIDSLRQVDEPGALADLAGYASYLTKEQKLWLLETRNVVARLDKLIGWSQEQIAELDVAETINKDVKEGVERQQREFLLRQQLAAIRKELAELDGKPASEEEDYRARVEAAELPEHVRKAAMTEVDKLERTAEASPEVGWIRTWLDTVLEMPWNSRTEDNFDIADAREVLDGTVNLAPEMINSDLATAASGGISLA